jgi:hypothetical protein
MLMVWPPAHDAASIATTSRSQVASPLLTPHPTQWCSFAALLRPPLAATLQALMDDDPSLLVKFREAAAAWAKEKPAAGSSAYIYHDITDGSVFCGHPDLGTAADRSDGSTRLAFILYYDDVEVVNALGSFCGVHKLGLFYWSIINIPPGQRMALHNIHLATVALESDIAYYGIEQIVSGPVGEPETGSSIGASLRLLDKGFNVQVDRAGKTEPHLLRGWLVLVAADYPAAGLLSGSMCGASARRFCRECEVDTANAGYNHRSPNSFVDDAKPSAYPLRTVASYIKDKLTCGCDSKRMGAYGWTSWNHAFTRIPKFDHCSGLPEDLMHVECEGTLKCESAAFIFYCVRILKCFTLEDLNRQLDAHPFPEGKRPPYFTEGILKGRANPTVKPKLKAKGKAVSRGITKPKRRAAPSAGLAAAAASVVAAGERYLPKKGCHVHMTSGDMMQFALHSLAIFQALGVPDNNPALCCWRTHIEYFRLLLQHSLTDAEVLKIDALIYSHHTQLVEIPSYDGIWKPKNHFACHFAHNVLRFGPPRHYWCMRFEALNQVFKKIAVGGSYRDTTRRCAIFWSMRSARMRSSQKFDSWGQVHIEEASGLICYQRNKLGSMDTTPPPVVELFSMMYPSSSFLSLSWVSKLYYYGATAITGFSWVEMTFFTRANGEAIKSLGHLPHNHGMFTLNGEVSVYVHCYPPLKMRSGSLYTSWPSGYVPPSGIVPLAECATVRWLWPVRSTETGDGSTEFHFVAEQ